MKRRTGVAILNIIIVLALLIYSNLFSWTEKFSCKYEDVDIMTGRVRATQYVLFFKVAEKIDDSAFSKVFPVEKVSAVKPEWRRVNIFRFGSHISPHFAFHGAIYQIHQFDTIWKVIPMSSEDKQKQVSQVLALWQASNSDTLAGDYIQKLEDKAIEDSDHIEK